MLFGRDHQYQNKKAEPRISDPQKATGAAGTSSERNQSPRLVLLQQGTGHGFDMLSNESQGRFPIYYEGDAPLRNNHSKRNRCASADDAQQLRDLGYGGLDTAPPKPDRNRRRSKPQSGRSSEHKRSSNARGCERQEKSPAMIHGQHPELQEISSLQNVTPVSGPSTTGTGMRCYYCGRTETPQWRTGPEGPLCNVCGLVWDKRDSKRQKRSLTD